MKKRIGVGILFLVFMLGGLGAQPPAPFSSLKGKVIDKNTNKPVAYVSIKIEGAKSFFSESEPDGSFKIRIPNIPSTAKFEKTGYNTQSFEVLKIPKFGDTLIIELTPSLKKTTPDVPEGFSKPELFGSWKILKLKGPSGKIKTKKNAELSKMAMQVKPLDNLTDSSNGKVAFHDGCNMGYGDYFTISDDRKVKIIPGADFTQTENSCENIENEIAIFKKFMDGMGDEISFKLKSSNTKLKIKSGVQSMVLIRL